MVLVDKTVSKKRCDLYTCNTNAQEVEVIELVYEFRTNLGNDETLLHTHSVCSSGFCLLGKVRWGSL